MINNQSPAPDDSEPVLSAAQVEYVRAVNDMVDRFKGKSFDESAVIAAQFILDADQLLRKLCAAEDITVGSPLYFAYFARTFNLLNDNIQAQSTKNMKADAKRALEAEGVDIHSTLGVENAPNIVKLLATLAMKAGATVQVIKKDLPHGS